uniref:Uncharacterized protein n=1 Tax=Arundo donax TaxID=35708 RepID=A0A0A8YA67_ARUDO
MSETSRHMHKDQRRQQQPHTGTITWLQ